VSALYFVADSYATRAQNAPVSVDNQEIMSGINLVTGPRSLEHNVINPQLIRQTLQFTVVVGYTD
jgi:hypothetical protein